jgi:pantetheine-phosphate adenylyltransferase
MTTAIYPGTFDPMTLGHVNIIERGIKLFDRVLVAVAPGTHKSPMFSLEQRMNLARQVIEPFSSQVEVISIEEYEYQLSGMNRQLAPEIETVFLTPEDRYQCISSTLVREVSRLGGDAHLFVPKVVNEALLERLKHGLADY